jgi:hypothetical protein
MLTEDLLKRNRGISPVRQGVANALTVLGGGKPTPYEDQDADLIDRMVKMQQLQTGSPQYLAQQEASKIQREDEKMRKEHQYKLGEKERELRLKKRLGYSNPFEGFFSNEQSSEQPQVSAEPEQEFDYDAFREQALAEGIESDAIEAFLQSADKSLIQMPTVTPVVSNTPQQETDPEVLEALKAGVPMALIQKMRGR